MSLSYSKQAEINSKHTAKITVLKMHFTIHSAVMKPTVFNCAMQSSRVTPSHCRVNQGESAIHIYTYTLGKAITSPGPDWTG